MSTRSKSAVVKVMLSEVDKINQENIRRQENTATRVIQGSSFVLSAPNLRACDV
jgi:hypothetical protein